jgi:hypothetical protein
MTVRRKHNNGHVPHALLGRINSARSGWTYLLEICHFEDYVGLIEAIDNRQIPVGFKRIYVQWDGYQLNRFLQNISLEEVEQVSEELSAEELLHIIYIRRIPEE